MKFGLDFSNKGSTSSSPPKFIKATLASSPIHCESFKAQDFKAKSLMNLNVKGKPHKANHQKAQSKKPKSHPAFIYHNKRHTHIHIRSQKLMHNYFCEMHAHSRPIIYRKATNHHNHAKLVYVGRQNKFSNIKCFYCMKLGHINNVCYYRLLHLSLLSKNYFEINKSRPTKVWVQKGV